MMTHIGKYLMKDGQICDVVSHKVTIALYRYQA